MMRMMVSAAFLVLSACGGPVGGGGGGGGLQSLEASWFCDGTASLTDWLVIMEAWTEGEAILVDAEIYEAGTFLTTLSMDDAGGGYWYREYWEDDVGSDCDSPSMRIIFWAEDSSGFDLSVEP